MARHKDPKKTAEKWARNLGRSTAEIKDGVAAVTEAPGIAAAAAQERMRERLLARIDDGTWADRVAAVPLEEWKDKMLTKGIRRIADGAEDAIPKQEEFYGQLNAHQEGIDRKLDKIDHVTLQDGIDRAVLQIQEMAKFRRK